MLLTLRNIIHISIQRNSLVVPVVAVICIIASGIYGCAGVSDAQYSLSKAESKFNKTLAQAEDAETRLDEHGIGTRNAIVDVPPEFFRPVDAGELSKVIEALAVHKNSVAKLLTRYESLVNERNAELEHYSNLWIERKHCLLVEEELLEKLTVSSVSIKDFPVDGSVEITAVIKRSSDELASSDTSSPSPESKAKEADALQKLIRSYEENHVDLERKNAEFIDSRNTLAELQLRVEATKAMLGIELIHQRHSQSQLQSLRRMQYLVAKEEPASFSSSLSGERDSAMMRSEHVQRDELGPTHARKSPLYRMSVLEKPVGEATLNQGAATRLQAKQNK